MDELRPTFNFRIDELAPLARLLRASYLRDQSDFVRLLPAAYAPAFLADFDARLADVDRLVRSDVKVGERQALAARQTEELNTLPALLGRLEARLRHAENLSVPAKRFGIEAVRQDLNNHDDEGLAEALKTLLQNVAANQASLEEQGQTAAETAQIQAAHAALVAGTTAQGANFSDQRLLTGANVALFNALHKKMKQLLADGKSLYKHTDKLRLKDYTLTQLRKRVRQERQQEEKGGSGGVAK